MEKETFMFSLDQKEHTVEPRYKEVGYNKTLL